MKVENGIAVEPDLLRLAYKEFDGILMIEDHLRFDLILALGLLAKIDQTLGVEQRIRVSFKAA